MSPRASGPTAVAVGHRQGHPEARAEVDIGEHLGHGPLGDDTARAQQQRMGEARGISSTWWVTRTVAGDIGSAAISPSVATSASLPPRSRPAAGSSSRRSSGSVIMARAICTRLRSPSDKGPERAPAHVPDAEPVEQHARAAGVVALVRLAPPADHRIGRRDDDISDRLAAGDAVRQRCAGQSDARAELEDIDCAEDLAQHGGVPGRRVNLGRCDLQQRRLAGSVRPQHHPAVAVADRPGDAVEKAVTRSARPTRRPARGRPSWGARLSLRVGNGVADDPTTVAPRRLTDMLALPRSARLVVWAGAWLGGTATLDDVVTRVHGEDEPHEVTGIPGQTGPGSLGFALGALRAAGLRALRVALPRPGDPHGLAGPPEVNAHALTAGEAVLAVGSPTALIPDVRAFGPPGDQGHLVTWSWRDATTPPAGGSFADADRALSRRSSPRARRWPTSMSHRGDRRSPSCSTTSGRSAPVSRFRAPSTGGAEPRRPGRPHTRSRGSGPER